MALILIITNLEMLQSTQALAFNIAKTKIVLLFHSCHKQFKKIIKYITVVRV